MKRIKKLQSLIKYPYYMTNLNELKYIAGYEGTAAAMLVTPDDFYFMTDTRYALEYSKKFGDKLILVESSYFDILKDLKQKIGFDILSLNTKSLTYSDYLRLSETIPDIEIIKVDNLINNMRMIKSKEEVENIKEALRITEDGFLYILSFLKEGVSEKDVAIELEHTFLLKGADDIAFPTIVLFGERSAYPHGHPSHERKLKKGDVVLIDMGVKFKNYNSDLTRTFTFGNINSNFKEVYNVVLEAQKRAFEAVKPGVNANIVDAAARNYISENKYGDYFGHGLGHGVGLEVHENPRLNQIDDTALELGMVFTVEPGVYLPGEFGIRIEDMVLCGRKNGIMLSDLPKETILSI